MTLEESAELEMDLDILRDFITESIAGLDSAANSLVVLERQPDNQHHVDSAFRIFHSIKGTCGFFGLHAIKTLSHRMETVLSGVRKKEIRPELSVISALLRGVDLLKGLCERAALHPAQQSLSQEEEAYLAQLELILSKKAPSSKDEALALLGELEAMRRHFSGADEMVFSKLVVFMQSLAGTEATASAVGSQEQAKDTELAPLAVGANPQAPVTSQIVKKSMRVDESTIDSFLSYTGELISSSESFSYLQGKLERERLSTDIKKEFKNAVLTFQTLSQDLQKSIMEIRKLPLNSIFSKYPRMIRDLSVTLQKKVSLEITGDELRVDKSIIELLDDPMVHILRNSLDHGFELPDLRRAAGKPAEGKLSVRASLDDSYLTLNVRDDGRGIDPERIKVAAIAKGVISAEQARSMSPKELINLIYAPGFSTAEKTTDVSGRGVGMDVVLTNIKKANGTVEVSSIPGKGTELLVKLPLTVTTLITQVLIVKAQEEQLIIPLDQVRAIEGMPASAIFTVQGQKEAINFRDRILPVIRLTERLGWQTASTRKHDSAAVLMAIIEVDRAHVAILIDGLVGIQQVAMKETGAFFSSNPYLKGGAILRDGRVGLLVSFKALIGELGEWGR